MASWLKLATGILQDEKISLIRELPEGDTLFVLWVGLLCLAMKKETDSLYISEGVPYTEEHLSTLFHVKLDTVRMGIEMFQRLGMVTRYSNDGALHVTNLEEHQALHKLDRQRTLTAERVRRHRDRKKLEDKSVTRYSVTGNGTEEEIEVEEYKRAQTGKPFDAEFDECWADYPKKKAKQAAYKAYVARRREGIDADVLHTATKNYAKERKGQDEQYTLNGSTFYGPNERWRDYVHGANGDTPKRKILPVCHRCGENYEGDDARYCDECLQKMSTE